MDRCQQFHHTTVLCKSHFLCQTFIISSGVTHMPGCILVKKPVIPVCVCRSSLNILFYGMFSNSARSVCHPTKHQPGKKLWPQDSFSIQQSPHRRWHPHQVFESCVQRVVQIYIVFTIPCDEKIQRCCVRYCQYRQYFYISVFFRSLFVPTEL